MSSDLHVILDKFSFLTKGIYQNKDSQHVCISQYQTNPHNLNRKNKPSRVLDKKTSAMLHIFTNMHLLVEHILPCNERNTKRYSCIVNVP